MWWVRARRFSLLRMTMLPPCVVVNGSAEHKTWVTQVVSRGALPCPRAAHVRESTGRPHATSANPLAL